MWQIKRTEFGNDVKDYAYGAYITDITEEDESLANKSTHVLKDSADLKAVNVQLL